MEEIISTINEIDSMVSSDISVYHDFSLLMFALISVEIHMYTLVVSANHMMKTWKKKT